MPSWLTSLVAGPLRMRRTPPRMCIPSGRFGYIGWADNMVTEVSVPWSVLGDPTQVDFVICAMAQDAGNIWTSFPSQNPASSNGAETFTHLYHLPDRNLSVAPNQMEIQSANAIEKEDDALNVAIVFHQHQPYYKNKLTGIRTPLGSRPYNDRVC